MKKFVLFFFIFSVFTGCLYYTVPFVTSSIEPMSCFARVKYNNVALYKTSAGTDIICMLEPTYFVEIKNTANDAFFEVNYFTLTGYVKKEEVECVRESPLTPYPQNIAFFTSPSFNVVLRSHPTTSDETVLTVLPSNTQVQFYGKIPGEEAVRNLGKIWYYCKVEKDNTTLTGYIYAPYTHTLTTITPNMESLELAEYVNVSELNALLTIKPNFLTIIVVLTILPTFLLLFLFFKKAKVK